MQLQCLYSFGITYIQNILISKESKGENKTMKKVLAIILALVMVSAASVCVFAASNNFYESPTGRPAPELIIGGNTSEDCFAWLEITGYSDRHLTPDGTRDKMEEAYDQITTAADLTALCGDLGAVADLLDIAHDDLAVSDLFDISWYGCDDHREHGGFEIQLKPEVLDNFVALLHYNNGVWELVSNAEVIGNGDILSFSVDSLSPFAIIVNAEEEPVDPPFAGDSTFIVASIVLMVASGVALIVVGTMIKKGRKEAQV